MPGQSGKTMNWDDAADKNLLLQIIAGQDVRVDYNLVAPKFGCSPSAVKQRVLKLKNQAKEAGFALRPNEEAGSGANDTDSPLKGKTAKGKAAAANKGKAKAVIAEEEEEVADANEDKPAAPVKKRGRKAKGADGLADTPAAKKQKTANSTTGPAGKGKEAGKGKAVIAPEASSPIHEDGAASPASSEGTTIKMEGVEDRGYDVKDLYYDGTEAGNVEGSGDVADVKDSNVAAEAMEA